MKTPQEVLDKVVTHLLTQNQKCTGDLDGCAYRGENGLMCAIGCLIDDEHFDYEFNLRSIDDRRVIRALEKSGVDCRISMSAQTDEFLTLFHVLDQLQDIHDSSAISNWREELSATAERFNLTFNPPIDMEKKLDPAKNGR